MASSAEPQSVMAATPSLFEVSCWWMALLVWHCNLSPWPHQLQKNSEAKYPLIFNNYQISQQIGFFLIKKEVLDHFSVCGVLCGLECMFAARNCATEQPLKIFSESTIPSLAIMGKL